MFEKISLQNVIFYRFWTSLTYSNSNSKKFLSQLCTQLAYSWNVEKEAVCIADSEHIKQVDLRTKGKINIANDYILFSKYRFKKCSAWSKAM